MTEMRIMEPGDSQTFQRPKWSEIAFKKRLSTVIATAGIRLSGANFEGIRLAA